MGSQRGRHSICVRVCVRVNSTFLILSLPLPFRFSNQKLVFSAFHLQFSLSFMALIFPLSFGATFPPKHPNTPQTLFYYIS